jgi:metallo-beta-lactamase class B
MTRNRVLIGVLACLLASSAAAQRGGRGGAQGITRGAEQPNQNRWNAKSPWGETERSAPIALQRKNSFKVFDNVYYVGFQTVSVYLVTTSAGLVLIDSGYAQTVDWLLESIRKAGFDPANIKYIFVTHSHVDHASGAARLTQITGARVGLSAEDWAAVERLQSAPGQQTFPIPIQRDLVLKDNDAMTVGDATFTFYVTPGHTPGATSIEFQVRDRGRSHRALVPGGLGLHYAPDWGPTFKKSMERLKQLGPWDAVLGNHPFLMPRDLAQIEEELKLPRTASNPALVGPAGVDAFFAAILKIVDEKLVAEPPSTPNSARPSSQ